MAPVTTDPTHPSPSPPPWVADLAVIVLVISISFVPFPDSPTRPVTPVMLGVVVLAAAVMTVRRRWPVVALTTCMVLYGTASLLGVTTQGIALATAVAMYSAAFRLLRKWTLLVGAVSVSLIVVFTLIAAIGNVADPRVVQFVLMLGLGAALGDATRSRREYISAAIERAERAEQTREAEARRQVSEERLRIARDLHDTVAHQISVISLNAGVASSVLSSNPERAKEALGTVRKAARTVLGEIGDLLAWLRTSEDEVEAEAAVRPQPGLDQLDGLFARFRAAGLELKVETEGDLGTVDGPVSTVAYRVIQEGLTNAHRHGADHRATLTLGVGHSRLTILVANPTRSDSTPPTGLRGGYGLLGLRERVAAVRGTVTAEPASSEYRLAVTIPLTKEASR
ncbi:MAG TPA: sensor histidine kinase [Propionibacteriaceae bacterium]|nr:sensor histidine kinase [Propionibacteriaceae bacterium]